MARPSAYDTNIKPHLEQIRKWRAAGATIPQICETLNIAESTYHKHMNIHTEFAEANKRGVNALVMDLRGELARQSFKHNLETVKVYTKKDEITGHETTYKEKTIKEIDGNIAAINLLLKNIDKEWANDPKYVELREREIRLKELIAEANNFDLNLEGK